MRFAHKGLEALWRADDAHKLNAGHVPRIRRILSDLQSANAPQDMKLPGYHLHRLKGDQRDLWSVRVSGNWRVTFRFDGDAATGIDLVDHH